MKRKSKQGNLFFREAALKYDESSRKHPAIQQRNEPFCSVPMPLRYGPEQTVFLHHS